jgi:hypothetical protein
MPTPPEVAGRRTGVPKKHHIDKRAAHIASGAGDDDDLLSTIEMAAWFGVSTQWLEIGRHKGYGPPFERLGPKIIRYRRGKARAYLDSRTYSRTSEYT